MGSIANIENNERINTIIQIIQKIYPDIEDLNLHLPFISFATKLIEAGKFIQTKISSPLFKKSRSYISYQSTIKYRKSMRKLRSKRKSKRHKSKRHKSKRHKSKRHKSTRKLRSKRKSTKRRKSTRKLRSRRKFI